MRFKKRRRTYRILDTRPSFERLPPLDDDTFSQRVSEQRLGRASPPGRPRRAKREVEILDRGSLMVRGRNPEAAAFSAQVIEQR